MLDSLKTPNLIFYSDFSSLAFQFLLDSFEDFYTDRNILVDSYWISHSGSTELLLLIKSGEE